MVCAFGAVPPGPVTIASIWRTARAVCGEITRNPRTLASVGCAASFVSVTGISSPSCANTVYACAIWNSDADRP